MKNDYLKEAIMHKENWTKLKKWFVISLYLFSFLGIITYIAFAFNAGVWLKISLVIFMVLIVIWLLLLNSVLYKSKNRILELIDVYQRS